jgi:hypothetical protein
VPGTGLVGYWNFNEASGATTPDSSGNNNTGTIVGATRTTSGWAGGALDFQSGNAHVAIPNTPTLGQLTNRLTLAAWVYPTSVGNGLTTLLHRSNAAGTFYNFTLYARVTSGGINGVPYFHINWNNNSALDAGESAQGSLALPLNQWSHLAATYDGAAMQLYLNGVLRGSASLPNGAIPPSAQPIWIGANGLFGHPFRGRIDEVRIYNRALSPGEIQALMTP